MSEWVHCNKCATRYSGNTSASFYLVECGHILCQRCAERTRAIKKCLICNKTSNVIALNKDVEQSVLDFFLPFESAFKRALEIYKFQTQHRSSLLQTLMDKYNYAKREYINCYNTNKHLMKENQTLRSMLRSSGKNPQRFVTSTPASHSSENNLTFQNTSMLSSIAPPAQLGITPSRDNNMMMKMYPGYPRRNLLLSSASSQGPSPAQRVPLSKLQEQPMVHRNSHLRSLEELRRSGKSQ